MATVPAERQPGATSSDAGVLRPEHAERHFQIWRAAAGSGVATWVERYWSVRWDLPAGTSYTSDVLTHPAIHLSLEEGTGPRHGFAMPAALLHGVVTRRFSVTLRGAGRVFGVKFRPGGFGAFTGDDVAGWTDQVLPLSHVFGTGCEALLRQVLDEERDERRAALVDQFLLARRPGPDPRYERLLVVVRQMLDDPGLTSVQQVVERTGISLRTLQRLFHRYVGVGPKWMLQRFRLHDAVVMLESPDTPDLATLAVELGWFDQAHFSRDFADLVGVPPATYATRH
jgi:AraC-like DNA-binding protein